MDVTGKAERAEIALKVRQYVATATETPLDAVSDDSSMETLQGWDSLAHLEIVAAIETLLGRQLTLDEIVSASSVGDWIRLVEAQLANGTVDRERGLDA